jgi:hypothetical protein
MATKGSSVGPAKSAGTRPSRPGTGKRGANEGRAFWGYPSALGHVLRFVRDGSALSAYLPS